jgi:uncharacterized protein
MGSPPTRTVLWRRMDRPGHDAARLASHGARWRLTGTAAFREGGRPCALTYAVDCDADWRTVTGTVAGWIGEREVGLELRRNQESRWFLNGIESAAVAGCVDVDYGFSPSTNLLPIRRLRLDVGTEAPVRAAWLRFPELTLEPLEQVYRRVAGGAYEYESRQGAFRAELTVDGEGIVTRYDNLWEAEPP